MKQNTTVTGLVSGVAEGKLNRKKTVRYRERTEKSKLRIRHGCDKNATNLITFDREGGGSSSSVAQHRR